uniref:hypothetical protein n=1 Tax=uncultured Dysgonomonas sp. TaxID=206096 RepID=UPI00262332CC|nr:hypothetical protein [uncultured Dysgonomonas sp.]
MKEIRQANKYINFDKACLIKNIQNIFKEKDIACPHKVIAALFESDEMVQSPDTNEDIEGIKFISLNKNIKNTKYLGFDPFIKMYDESKILQFNLKSRAKRKDTLFTLYQIFRCYQSNIGALFIIS